MLDGDVRVLSRSGCTSISRIHRGTSALPSLCKGRFALALAMKRLLQLLHTSAKYLTATGQNGWNDLSLQSQLEQDDCVIVSNRRSKGSVCVVGTVCRVSVGELQLGLVFNIQDTSKCNCDCLLSCVVDMECFLMPWEGCHSHTLPILPVRLWQWYPGGTESIAFLYPSVSASTRCLSQQDVCICVCWRCMSAEQGQLDFNLLGKISCLWSFMEKRDLFLPLEVCHIPILTLIQSMPVMNHKE